MAKAVYPNGVLQWTPRQDQVNVIFANDPNSLALEIGAIESIVGTTPQTESSPPAGSAVSYATMSARLSAANNNALMPVVSAANPSGFFIGSGAQQFNHYTTQVFDPYKIWNGTDLTIPVNGWWSIRADQKWNQHGNNFEGLNILFLYLNGNWIDFHHWDWSAWLAQPAQVHQAANNLNSNGWTQLRWEGLLHQGDRIQMLSANATYCPGIQITNMTLKAACHRTISSSLGSFVSG